MGKIQDYNTGYPSAYTTLTGLVQKEEKKREDEVSSMYIHVFYCSMAKWDLSFSVVDWAESTARLTQLNTTFD